MATIAEECRVMAVESIALAMKAKDRASKQRYFDKARAWQILADHVELTAHKVRRGAA